MLPPFPKAIVVSSSAMSQVGSLNRPGELRASQAVSSSCYKADLSAETTVFLHIGSERQPEAAELWSASSRSLSSPRCPTWRTSQPWAMNQWVSGSVRAAADVACAVLHPSAPAVGLHMAQLCQPNACASLGTSPAIVSSKRDTFETPMRVQCMCACPYCEIHSCSAR